MKTPALPFLFLLILASCGMGKIDAGKAKILVGGLLHDVKTENYAALDNYYSSSFNASEPLDKKEEKFRQLKSAMGAMISYEPMSSKESYDSDKGINQLELKYKVKYVRVTVQETFLVINDEGESKIIFQNIENLK
ncbi:MAG: hypothetical protein NT126_04050 [Bacteroidetes bacterium]|nr:hypothetical protein [Bacteroidota bacterium]